MEVFDYVIMGIGCILIVIGLLLFVSGKRESANHSQVEGFGIKLNVSNPSIILIVFGIGLVLVPRLLPNQLSQPELLETASQLPPPQTREVSVQQQSTDTPTNVATQPSQTATTNSPAISSQSAQDQAPQVWFPEGQWHMTGYELNGIDQTGFVEASILFVKRSPTKVSWNSHFIISDIWGNVTNYQYQGEINSTGSAYHLLISQSNDPNFRNFGAIPMEFKLENNNQVHMRYNYGGADLLTHWMQ